MRTDARVNLSGIRHALRRSLGLVLGICSVGAGYVQELGPPAMRWQRPSFVRFEVLSALPPLDMGKDLAASQSGTNQAPSVITTNLIDQTGLELSLGMTNETAAPYSPQTPGLPYDARGLLSPEWLATIFYTPGRTNAIGTLAMPVPFIPPLVPLSSSATITKGVP